MTVHIAMKHVIKLFALFAVTTTSFAQGTAFTYQGRLDIGGLPATGIYDLRFAMFDADVGGAQQGKISTNLATALSDGLFAVTLNFGDVPFDGSPRYLELGVRTNGGAAFVTLTPRQRITPAPYAIRAANAGSAEFLNGTVSASQLTGTISSNNIGVGTITTVMLADGLVGSNQLADNAVTADKIGGVLLAGQVPELDAAKITSGTLADERLSPNVTLLGPNIAGNEVAATTITPNNLDLATFETTFWKSTGNEGTIAGTHFLGTTDDQALELRVNGQRALRLEDNGDGSDLGFEPDGAPNVIGGSSANTVSGTAVGVTIAGGGATNWSGFTGFQNHAAASYVSIGGGLGNVIRSGAWSATVSGGLGNVIGTNSESATIGGGFGNGIGSGASHATIPGGRSNAVGDGATNAFAAGHRAIANHSGTFVWADGQNSSFTSTGTNQFLIRARGGVGIGTPSPAADLHVRGSGTNGAVIITPNISDSQSQILLAENQSASLGFIIRNAGNEGGNPLHFIPLNSGSVEGNPVLTLERNGGFVGVGTNNPSARLHIGGVPGTDGIKFPDGSVQTRAVSVLRSTSTTIDPPLMAAGTGNAYVISLPGATPGSVAMVSPLSPLGGGIIVGPAFVNANDNVTFYIQNLSNAATDPPPVQYTIAVIP